MEFPVIDLVLGGLNLQSVNTGLVIFPGAGQTDGVVYRLDNIEWKATTGAADSPVAGTWKIASEAGALKVGPGEFDGSWWQLGTADVTTRACLLDDLYVSMQTDLSKIVPVMRRGLRLAGRCRGVRDTD